MLSVGATSNGPALVRSSINRFSEIYENEIVKVLCKEDDVEEDLYAMVTMNTGRVLGVRYLTATDKIYKSATCYELEEDTQPV